MARRNPRGRTTQRTQGMSQAQFEANMDLVDCESCDRQFNLSGQTYYGPLCPSCRDD